MDPVTYAAIILLVGGVIATVVPLVPGGALSLAGVYLHWWHSGYAEPGLLSLAVLTILGMLALTAELVGAPLAARSGGASWGTSTVAGVVGVALLFVSGPLGLLAGLIVTVFVIEYARGGDVDASAKAAFITPIGILGATAVQVLLTASVLLLFVLTVFVL